MDALVTTLKEDFNNDELSKIDEIKIAVSNGEATEILGCWLNGTTVGAYIRTTGNMQICDSEGTVTVGSETYMDLPSNTQTVYFKGTSGNVFIGGKGYLGGFSLRSNRTVVDIEELSNLRWNRTGIIYAIANNADGPNCFVGDISKLKLTKDISNSLFFADNSTLYGSIDNLLKTIQVNTLGLNFTKIEFNLESLSHQTNCKAQFYCDGVSGNIKYACYNKRVLGGTTTIEFNVKDGSFQNVYGSIEELVALGLTVVGGAGSMKLYNLKNLPNVTYQGVSVSENTNIPSISPVLSWDAQGNISWS
jgi:hypothetical protein